SKRLNQWINKQVSQSPKGRDVQYWFISPSLSRDNQTHLPQLHWAASPKSWVERVDVKSSSTQGWADGLLTDIAHVRAHIR
ncbi:2-succinyl-5-enolpyruvyl-6-hydroxy-3-cyclohexene-1-carboxylic-acid synthase, partial [Vibrio sp. 506]|nr:2-succinyl-5-enolpyruvyl-6-hydroxy-3-cyclohexene-1-carboxylic-acid synthase [Vibrio sp. 506]